MYRLLSMRKGLSLKYQIHKLHHASLVRDTMCMFSIGSLTHKNSSVLEEKNTFI